MMRRFSWLLFAFLCVAVGLYPLAYLWIDRRFGLLATKSADLLADFAWNVGFYAHIMLGGLALLVGWPQFSARLRRERPVLHRTFGKIYVGAALPSALAGIGIGTQATGGAIAAAGFIVLGLVWFGSTLGGFWHIRQGRVAAHRRWMLFSFAACFAAVTLRIWLPILTAVFGDFIPAYRVVAWLCWVPNLAVAAALARKINSNH